MTDKKTACLCGDKCSCLANHAHEGTMSRYNEEASAIAAQRLQQHAAAMADRDTLRLKMMAEWTRPTA